jgi:hypothetical protein
MSDVFPWHHRNVPRLSGHGEHTECKSLVWSFSLVQCGVVHPSLPQHACTFLNLSSSLPSRSSLCPFIFRSCPETWWLSKNWITLYHPRKGDWNLLVIQPQQVDILTVFVLEPVSALDLLGSAIWYSTMYSGNSSGTVLGAVCYYM